METVDEILERIHLKKGSLASLPPAVIQEIFIDLSIGQILKICRSSVAFNSVCGRESLWQIKVWNDFGIEKKYWDTWRKTAENLLKMKMINLNKKWVNGMTYNEVINQIANRSEFEAEEKLDINRRMINGARNIPRYTIDELRDFITRLGETHIVTNDRHLPATQLKVILNIRIHGLWDAQLQHLPNTITFPHIAGHREKFMEAMLGHYYDEESLDAKTIELLGRRLTDKEFEIIQDTLTREFAIINLAAYR